MSYVLYMLSVFVLKHEMPMRTFIYQFPAVALMDTGLLFPVDLLSVIWCPQYLTAICDLKEREVLMLLPQKCKCLPHFVVISILWWCFPYGTLLGCVLWDCCLFTER